MKVRKTEEANESYWAEIGTTAGDRGIGGSVGLGNGVMTITVSWSETDIGLALA